MSDTYEKARRALATNRELLALGHERFEAEGATFVRNRDVPAIRDANHVTALRASTPGEIDRLLERTEREFAGFPHRRFDADSETPPAFVARLALEGYEHTDALIMLLQGPLAGRPKAVEIRPVETEADWAAYAALMRIDWADYEAHMQRRGHKAGEGVGEAMLRSRRLKSGVNWWMAYVDGTARAYFSSWVAPDGTGQVEDLFTHPDFRHRGLATALIHHSVADCRRRGARDVVIVCDPSDTPKQMYHALGFRPVAVKSDLWKRVDET